MIIIMEKNITLESLSKINEFFKKSELTIECVDQNKSIYLVTGDTTKLDEQSVLSLEGITSCYRITTPYKLSSRKTHPENTIVRVGDVIFGGQNQVIIAGPCSVESPEQIDLIAKGVKEAGANVLRGGAYKPRSSVYYFQGFGSIGLKYLYEAGVKYHIPVVSEITSISQIDEFLEMVDIIQVGARNMQNFELLKALGRIQKPVMLKRGPANTIDEWLMSAEYILAGGNPNVILCERGIRTFEKKTRYTLDLSVVQVVKMISHLPIIVDPSHATGSHKLVESMTLAAIAANADGIMIEVHNEPTEALSDGNQTLKLSKLKKLICTSRQISKIIGRDI